MCQTVSVTSGGGRPGSTYLMEPGRPGGGVVEYDETGGDILESSVAVPHLRVQPADDNSGEWMGAGAGPSSRCPTANCKTCRRG